MSKPRILYGFGQVYVDDRTGLEWIRVDKNYVWNNIHGSGGWFAGEHLTQKGKLKEEEIREEIDAALRFLSKRGYRLEKQE